MFLSYYFTSCQKRTLNATLKKDVEIVTRNLHSLYLL